MATSAQLDSDIEKAKRAKKELRELFTHHFVNIRQIYKVQNGHLQYLLSNGEYPQLKFLLSQYIEFNNDKDFFGTIFGSIQKDYQNRWNFWVRKLIQASVLEDFLDIIPRDTADINVGQPVLVGVVSDKPVRFVLEIKTYTRILEYLIEKR